MDKKCLSALSKNIAENKKEFINQIMQETGYGFRDCEDLVNGSIELVSFFDKHIQEISSLIPSKTIHSFFDHSIPCKISLESKAYGVVAVITPQNAPLILELTVILNALASGNSIILRPSSQCRETMALLVDVLNKSLSSDVLKKIKIVTSSATDFLKESYLKANLIHYIGSSKYGSKIMIDAISNNVKPLVDGDGSSVVIIDKSADLNKAVKACRDGMIRCNGEICSSVRMMVVDRDVYEQFCGMLCSELKDIKVGNPLIDPSVDIGPLFNETQVSNIQDAGKDLKILFGDIAPHSLGPDYTGPILFELKAGDTDFLKKGIFGPAAGITSYKDQEWKKWLGSNPYPLNDVVFSANQSFIEEIKSESRAPRIVINHDPSIESAFEPWGAFLPGGFNDVSFWVNKYRKIIQLDVV